MSEDDEQSKYLFTRDQHLKQGRNTNPKPIVPIVSGKKKLVDSDLTQITKPPEDQASDQEEPQQNDIFESSNDIISMLKEQKPIMTIYEIKECKNILEPYAHLIHIMYCIVGILIGVVICNNKSIMNQIRKQ